MKDGGLAAFLTPTHVVPSVHTVVGGRSLFPSSFRHPLRSLSIHLERSRKSIKENQEAAAGRQQQPSHVGSTPCHCM